MRPFNQQELDHMTLDRAERITRTLAASREIRAWRLIQEIDRLRALTGDPTDQHNGHVYLSTGCLHDHHDHCAAMIGVNGEKRPATCKWCDAHCICPCHHRPPS